MELFAAARNIGMALGGRLRPVTAGGSTRQKVVLKGILFTLLALVMSAFCSADMDQFNALSQLASPPNERMLQPGKTVSRDRILPAFGNQTRHFGLVS